MEVNYFMIPVDLMNAQLQLAGAQLTKAKVSKLDVPLSINEHVLRPAGSMQPHTNDHALVVC